VSSLTGVGAVIGHTYPGAYFMAISRGAFNKGLEFSSMVGSFWPLFLAVPVIFGLSILLTKKQEG
jgi:ribosome-dependent ATPase